MFQFNLTLGFPTPWLVFFNFFSTVYAVYLFSVLFYLIFVIMGKLAKALWDSATLP